MQSLNKRPPPTHALLLALVLLAPAPAIAQQPLEAFLDSADTHGLDVREAIALREQARSQVDEARARLLPDFTATLGYTRNELEVLVRIPRDAGEFQTATITPYDQIEGRFALSIPIVDVGAWSTFSASEVTADAATERAEASRTELHVAVVTAYYQLVATRALRDAAVRTLAAAEENLAVVEARVLAGLASELDRQRAISDVERQRQAQAEADFQEAVARRSLETLTGLPPSDAQGPSLDDDLRPEPALDSFLAGGPELADVRAARRDVRAAELAHDAAWQAMLPTLRGTATERGTNAAGFGPNFQWSLGLTLTWQIDFGRPAAMETREHALEVARVREERVEQQAETRIYEAWHRVRSLLARAAAARASEAASERAVEVAHARYEAGTGTQLELSQAERDLFSARVARIQADGDLRVARLVLHLRAGEPITAGAR